MNEQEITNEFNLALRAEYSEHLSEDLLRALKIALKELTPRQLKIPNAEYCIILDPDKDSFNYHQVSHLLNNFHNFPLAFYESKGFTLAQYRGFYEELTYLVAKWEEFVQPHRKTMNKKMEILGKQGGGTGAKIIQANK